MKSWDMEVQEESDYYGGPEGKQRGYGGTEVVECLCLHDMFDPSNKAHRAELRLVKVN